MLENFHAGKGRAGPAGTSNEGSEGFPSQPEQGCLSSNARLGLVRRLHNFLSIFSSFSS